MTTKDLKCHLRDAGCSPEQIEAALSLYSEGRTDEEIRLLRSHRSQLLEELHFSQRRLDCLDLLIHKIEKQGKAES